MMKIFRYVYSKFTGPSGLGKNGACPLRGRRSSKVEIENALADVIDDITGLSSRD
jgi:hypothetical protein